MSDLNNFYENPPKTRQELRDYLTSWLQNIEDAFSLIIHGETFIQEKGFRRGFHTHCVFRSSLTNEYVWWVSEDFDLELFPKRRFSTYESLLENVINDYYIAWKLKD